ncbi:unnamed protein product [Rotaria sp. Silwood2]|nr:unnamed protein product [Rotaria sp. Silwood2]CAF3353315.1 unnamed protein product [Rotaria sp. Silwood2]CAF4472073.1 unnamed protein product [Rotaria sp. Silwood2]CAF4489319.1 unnamed protein product [Rotaria sp. Silwood2]
MVNHITYDLDEYLSPTNVLICSKCMGIGHFKKQCKQVNETCRTHDEQYTDLKMHKCSQIEKCIHCQQNHKSNALKCPVIKSFRADLTKILLQMNNCTKPTALLNNNINNYVCDPLGYPPLPPAQAP